MEGTWMTIKLSAYVAAGGRTARPARRQRQAVKSQTVAPARAVPTPRCIRGVPDSGADAADLLQHPNLAERLTDYMGWEYIEIDPFVAGVLALGFIYGAYFTETFRGAILAVPRGQLEAGAAYGLARGQRFSDRDVPANDALCACRASAITGMVMLKATALVSIIGLAGPGQGRAGCRQKHLQLFFFLVLAARSTW